MRFTPEMIQAATITGLLASLYSTQSYGDYWMGFDGGNGSGECTLFQANSDFHNSAMKSQALGPKEQGGGAGVLKEESSEAVVVETTRVDTGQPMLVILTASKDACESRRHSGQQKDATPGVWWAADAPAIAFGMESCTRFNVNSVEEQLTRLSKKYGPSLVNPRIEKVGDSDKAFFASRNDGAGKAINYAYFSSKKSCDEYVSSSSASTDADQRKVTGSNNNASVRKDNPIEPSPKIEFMTEYAERVISGYRFVCTQSGKTASLMNALERSMLDSNSMGNGVRKLYVTADSREEEVRIYHQVRGTDGFLGPSHVVMTINRWNELQLHGIRKDALMLECYR